MVDAAVGRLKGVSSEREEIVVDEMRRRTERRFEFGSEGKRRKRTRKVLTRSNPFPFLRRWRSDDWEQRVGGRK